MSLLNQIKDAQLQARKERDEIKSSLFTTLYSEASMKGKNDGNRDSTDEEVIAVIKKFLNGVNETLEALKFSSDGRVKVAVLEKEILESLLPKQLSEDELRIAISALIAGLEERNPKAMGKIMAGLKAQFAGLYDGAVASKLIKEML